MNDRQPTLIDHFLGSIDSGLKTLSKSAKSTGRAYPAKGVQEAQLSDKERSHAAGLMRINHTGEICAQALYEGQAMMARDEVIKAKLKEAAAEEGDHLKWCQRRINELGESSSKLDPLFYAGAFSLGAVASFAGDKWNMGFLAETERQVEAHLETHIDKLPEGDLRSRAIVEQMKIDEAEHAQMAVDNGAAELPAPISSLMRMSANIMKFFAYRF